MKKHPECSRWFRVRTFLQTISIECHIDNSLNEIPIDIKNPFTLNITIFVTTWSDYGCRIDHDTISCKHSLLSFIERDFLTLIITKCSLLRWLSDRRNRFFSNRPKLSTFIIISLLLLLILILPLFLQYEPCPWNSADRGPQSVNQCPIEDFN